MSLFRRHAAPCAFPADESWVILSPIEASIKRKIEAVGTPLSEWDIHIYRGVLTGCNEAFIIPTARRDEILAACRDEDERRRTAELIRPILRGRDIKRYGYEWAELWIIGTHNGVRGKFPRIDIEDYPAVKAHLDQYWDKIAVRDDQGATPYNLRNCAYWEDFEKPKIVWAELARTGNAFAIDYNKKLIANTAYMITTKNQSKKELQYLLALLNSRVVLYALDRISTRFDDNGWRWLRQFVERLYIPRMIDSKYILSLQQEEETSATREKLNQAIAEVYQLDQSEIDYINRILKGY
ncbi:MAG: class I SAM-dependent DNA methyltransferase [Prevotellaceae bacterium]|nr:class I SAM-dependent DNA methyltransferase [Prevotellaceae bacterium]